MKITTASSMLMNGWEISRGSWNDEKFIRKLPFVSHVEVCVDGEFFKWTSTKEDLSAIDWNVCKIDSDITSSLRVIEEVDDLEVDEEDYVY